jgi:hypothetical protein
METINIELLNKIMPYFTADNFYKMVMYLTVLANDGIVVCDKSLDDFIYIDVFGKEPAHSKLWDLLQEEYEKWVEDKE